MIINNIEVPFNGTKYLADYDKKNELDVERFLKHSHAVVKLNEEFEHYEIEADEE